MEAAIHPPGPTNPNFMLFLGGRPPPGFRNSETFKTTANLEKVRKTNEEVITLLVVQLQSLFPEMRIWLGTHEHEEVVGGVAVDDTEARMARDGWNKAKKNFLNKPTGAATEDEAEATAQSDLCEALSDGNKVLAPPPAKKEAPRPARKSALFDTEKKCYNCRASRRTTSSHWLN